MSKTLTRAAAGAIVVLAVAFILTPTAQVTAYSGPVVPAHIDADNRWVPGGAEGPQKSGLRVAIEGRLRWLGLVGVEGF